MAYLNKVMLIGNAGRDPEVKTWDGGEIVKFSLATSKQWKKDGEKKETVTWHDITIFGKLGEIAKTYIKKGTSLFIEGELRMDTWDDEEGKKRSKWYVVAESFQLLGTRPDAASATVAAPTATAAQPVATPPAKKVKNYAPGADNSHLDDELPF